MSAAACAGQPVIVLAAGHGKRMGGPKLFTEHEGRTFLERILQRCRETSARVTLVSDPRFRPRLEALLSTLPAPFPRIVEADGTLDMLDSVQAALRAGPYEPGVWLWPVDAPFISAAGWRRAVEKVARVPNSVRKLRAGGRTGPRDHAEQITPQNEEEERPQQRHVAIRIVTADCPSRNLIADKQ